MIGTMLTLQSETAGGSGPMPAPDSHRQHKCGLFQRALLGASGNMTVLVVHAVSYQIWRVLWLLVVFQLDRVGGGIVRLVPGEHY